MNIPDIKRFTPSLQRIHLVLALLFTLAASGAPVAPVSAVIPGLGEGSRHIDYPVEDLSTDPELSSGSSAVSDTSFVNEEQQPIVAQPETPIASEPKYDLSPAETAELLAQLSVINAEDMKDLELSLDRKMQFLRDRLLFFPKQFGSSRVIGRVGNQMIFFVRYDALNALEDYVEGFFVTKQNDMGGLGLYFITGNLLYGNPEYYEVIGAGSMGSNYDDPFLSELENYINSVNNQ